MNCIICQDSAIEHLQENTHCKCKYKYHIECWIDYVHSKDKITCPLCRKVITIKSTPKSVSNRIEIIQSPVIQATVPYTPEQPGQQGQQISYQEFVDIIRQNDINHSAIQIHSTTQSSLSNNLSSNKIVKISIGLGILTAIIILFIVYLV